MGRRDHRRSQGTLGMFGSPPLDMRSIHDGVGPWWLGPLWTPMRPPSWDIVAQFRELLRYSAAGVIQGVLVSGVSVLLLFVGWPIRGLSFVLLALGLPMWAYSAVSLVPRRNRLLLREYASEKPSLFEWYRLAIAREDIRAARRMTLLHIACLASTLLIVGVMQPGEAVWPWFGLLLAVSASFVALFAAVWALRLNSAGVRRAFLHGS